MITILDHTLYGKEKKTKLDLGIFERKGNDNILKELDQKVFLEEGFERKNTVKVS